MIIDHVAIFVEIVVVVVVGGGGGGVVRAVVMQLVSVFSPFNHCGLYQG